MGRGGITTVLSRDRWIGQGVWEWRACRFKASPYLHNNGMAFLAITLHWAGCVIPNQDICVKNYSVVDSLNVNLIEQHIMLLVLQAMSTSKLIGHSSDLPN